MHIRRFDVKGFAFIADRMKDLRHDRTGPPARLGFPHIEDMILLTAKS